MAETPKTALIVGAGDGLSASLARKLSAAGFRVALAARDIDKLAAVIEQTGATAFRCDASDADQVAHLFEQVEGQLSAPDVVIYNAAAWTNGRFVDLDLADVRLALGTSALGAFLVAQQAARRMVARGSGVILFTGATASIRGSARFAPFAMGKFAARGLAQSLARELGPEGVHVAHVIIDGPIRGARFPGSPDKPDALLEPDAIAETYLALIAQPRSAWTHELELRAWTEKF